MRERAVQRTPEAALTDSAPRYSILLIGYRSLEFLVPCLESVQAGVFPDWELLFLDNDSPEPEAELVEARFSSDSRIRVFRSERNLFFAGGVNHLARQARGEYIVLLNPDTTVDAGWLDALEAHRRTSPIDVGQMELRLMRSPGQRQTVGCMVDRAILVRQIPVEEGDRRFPIFSAVGAGLAIRKDLFEGLGGFDEDFEMYFEESDFCWRAWIAGASVEYLPGAIVFHLVGGSSPDPTAFDRSQYRFHRNRIWSMAKNMQRRNLVVFLPVHLLLQLGEIVRHLLLRRWSKARTHFLAVRDAFAGMGRFLAKRKTVARIRRRSDADLAALGLVKPLIGH